MSRDLSALFERNREWAARVESASPGFFTGLLAQQRPRFMWLGCADSRVPANELVDLLPGEMFVHRNVANLLVHSDLNALSVVQYAVDVLGVEHIIVVGHSNCGGIRAALADQRSGLVDNWLRHVQDVRDTHWAFLDSLEDAFRVDALVELNVLEQARNVCRTTIVRDAWQRGQTLVVHGWVYGLHDGLLKDLSLTASSIAEVEAAYQHALERLTSRWQTRQQEA